MHFLNNQYVIGYVVAGLISALYYTIQEVREKGDNYRTKSAEVFGAFIGWPLCALYQIVNLCCWIAPFRRFDEMLIFLFKKRP